ncbi:hypothetical protein GF385_02995 [Candidatus Dependentiae bacterium]|nr:hypothetical protein [Candidatus Dependentiae bacterium]
MKSYNFTPHTADVRLEVKADNLEELLKVSLEGMNQLIKKDFCNNASNFDLKHSLEIGSLDTSALLIDFLSEVLTYSQVNKAVYCKVNFKKLEKNSLECTIMGKKVESFDEDIKAVTYHEAEVKKEDDILKSTIIFDI